MENTASTFLVGDMVNHHKEERVEWKITDYFSQPQKADSCYQSPSFYCLGTKWCILLYPNGQRLDQTVGSICIYLNVQTSIPCYPVIFTLRIKDPPVRNKNFTTTYTFSELNTSIGWPNMVERSCLRRTMVNDPTRSTLTVYCSISANLETLKDVACQTSVDNTVYLCRDFQDLLQSGQKSDLTIEVQGRVFKFHKLILEARSSVFSAMFDHNMREKIDSVVKIDDCNPDSFQDFLHYIYTGNFGNLTWDNVIPLFKIADRYCITELKSQCLEFIKGDFTVENACDILALADMHNETSLKVVAELLLVQNMSTFKNTDKWRLFMAENPSLALEVLMRCIPNNRSSRNA